MSYYDFQTQAKTCLTQKSAKYIKMKNIVLFHMIMVFAQV